MSSGSPHHTKPSHAAERRLEASLPKQATQRIDRVESDPRTDPEVAWCRQRLDRPGDEIYVHLIRDPEDPSRSPRPIGGQVDRTPHRTLDKRDLEAIRAEILHHLSDGEPRTFNRLTVELCDVTADIAFGTVADEALWSLVGEYVEHTVEIPILFRLLPHLRDDAGLRQGHLAPAPGSQMSLAFSV